MTERRVKVTLDGDINPYTRALARAAAETKAFTSELDSSSTRMAALTQSALALGPALVPITAAATPAIAGLANELGVGIAAVGVGILAFKGLGKSLEAVNNASIDPTTANLQKMNEQLAQLGPAGQDFVLFLQKARPELQHLQELARAGLFPGLEQGIRSLSGVLPDAERVITTISTTLGQLASEAGTNLDSPRWHEFFDFLDKDARPTLLAMGRSLGNLAEGFASLWMDFAPLETNFSTGFLHMSRDFATWTDGLDKTKDFQEFIAYIDKNGPAAWDTLGALGNALLQIVEAAAPVGQATLPVIKALANAVAALADSKLGPLIIGVVALASALSRLKAIGIAANSAALGSLGGRSGYGGLGATLKAATVATTELRVAQEKLAVSSVAARDAQFALVPTGAKRQALTSYIGDLKAVGAAEQTAAEASRARNVQLRTLAGGAALLGVAMTGLDKKMGLTNTTSLALAGSLVGPWGTAVGAGVGLALDFSKRTDGIGAAMQRAKTAVDQNSISLKAQAAAIDEVRQKQNATGEPVPAGGRFASNNTGQAAANAKDLSALQAQYEQNVRKAQDAAFAEAGLAAQMANASKATRDETYAMLENIRAKNAAADATENAFAAETNYRQALKDAQAQAKTNNAGINGSSDAALKNRGALDQLATAWNRVADAGNATTGDLKKARANFIQVAESMGVSKQAAKALADELFHLPSPKPTITVIDKASGVIKTVIKELNAANGKVAVTTIRTNRVTHVSTIYTSGGLHGSSKADGGEIRGPGGPRDDVIPLMASNKEIIVNARDAQEHRDLILAINAGRFRGRSPQFFANGGEVQRMASANYLAPAASAPSSGSLDGLTAAEVLRVVDARLASVTINANVGVSRRNAAEIVAVGNDSQSRLR